MKFSSRGFTLVELMIVIAIIGILAAALFPSLSAYLKRSRDAGRGANMNTIATAVGAYYSDRERYPAATAAGCANSTDLDTNYLPKGVPSDPQPTNWNGCLPVGQYGFGSGTVNSSPVFFITAIFENPNGGNTGSVGGYTGNAVTQPNFTASKGSGSGYVLQN